MFTVAASTSAWLIAEISASNDVISVLVDGRASEAVPFSVCGMDKTAVTTIAIMGFLLDDHADALVAKALSAEDPTRLLQRLDAYRDTIGRASGRERVCQYGVDLGGHSIIKNNTNKST